MLRPICATCGREMACERNETTVLLGGCAYSGDLCRCPTCGCAVVVGCGRPADMADPHSWGPLTVAQARAEGTLVEVTG